MIVCNITSLGPTLSLAEAKIHVVEILRGECSQSLYFLFRWLLHWNALNKSLPSVLHEIAGLPSTQANK